MSKHFTQHEHPKFSALKSRYALVDEAYTGENVHGWLTQHRQGESAESFIVRKQLSTFLPYTASVLDSLVGVAFQNESAIERHWGALGDPAVSGSMAYDLARDIDGEGRNYDITLRMAALDLLKYQTVHALIDVQEGRPVLRLIPATAVSNWFDEAGRLTEAIIKEEVDTRRSVMDDPGSTTQYLYINSAGWARYRPEGEDAVMVSEGVWSDTREWVDRAGLPVAPLVRVTLPWRRYVAHMLATAHRALHNQQSDADHLQRMASFPKLVLKAEDLAFEAAVECLRKGSNVLQESPEVSGGHRYISPSTDAITSAREGLAAKIGYYYTTAFSLLDLEGSVQKTATEIVAERSTGLQAALSLLTAALEDVDTACLFMLNQAATSDPAGWRAAGATWPAVTGALTISEVQES